jgi:protein-tyrosine phosphatase
MKKQGFKSIISLMSEDEVAFYAKLELGATDLLDFYRKQGFEVAAIPWKDPAHVRSNPSALKAKEAKVCRQAIQDFDRLPKPVLLHCSAGVDRSSPVLAYIAKFRGGNPGVA